MKKIKSGGFTLIELLVVVGILAILLAITLIAINPARQFKQSNDTKRKSDVNAILNAVNQYQSDQNGSLPGAIATTAKEIGAPESTTLADLCSTLVPLYIAGIPVDPNVNGGNGKGAPITAPCPATYTTGYSILTNGTDNRVTVTAVPEIVTSISVTR